MAINLNKYKQELAAAWKDVLNEKTDTDWALFGYEGLSNDLKLINTGSGGLDEMIDDLNSGKIMYAFVKIHDPKTSLPKCVLIHWQGEGANTVRKGMCAKHLRDVENFFSGAITINARNEEEVEPQLIVDKVANAGSAYSFKAPRGDNSGPRMAVGSNYKRINPLAEINATERDQFWHKEELEEKQRVEEERQRREAERRMQEEEVKRREEMEAKKREEVTQMRDNTIDRIKEAEKQALASSVAEDDGQLHPRADENEVKVNSSDLMRLQRNAETHNLIAQRTIDARSIFEQNMAAGQIKKTPEKPVRASILKAQQEKQQQQQQQLQRQEEGSGMQQQEQREHSDDEGDQFATIKRCPKDGDKRGALSSLQEAPKEGMEVKKMVAEVQQIDEQQFVDTVIYGDSGIKARALYDYQAADDTEITIDPDDIITHIEMVDEGWWQGLGPDGTYGLFPANYVKLL